LKINTKVAGMVIAILSAEVIMSKVLLLILVAAGLTLTGAACSSHYGDRNPYSNGGYAGGYGYDYGRVRQLAYDLERTTDNLREEAKRSRVNGRVVDELEDVNDKAEDLRHEVEHKRDLRSSSDEFRDVSKEYYEARDALQRYSWYGAPQYLERDLQRVNAILSELSRYYGYGRY